MRKILYITNIPSPYKVEFFNTLGNNYKLTVVFDGVGAADRDKSWESINAVNFNYEIISKKNINPLKLHIDIIEIIKKDKYDLYIVSNTAEIEYIRAFLKSSDTQKYFKDYIAASSLNISKADAIKKIIEDNKIKNAVYIGDTIIDLKASNINNIPFVQAKYGFGEDLKTEYCINNLKELPKVLEKLCIRKEK